MDYEPLFISNKRTSIGSYDLAAIRFGYFGESPTSKLAFCTDEEIDYSYFCNRGDLGDPADYVIAAAENGVSFLSKSTIALPSHVDKPMMGTITNLYSLAAKAEWSMRCNETDVDLITGLGARLNAAQRRLERFLGAAPASLAVRTNLAKLRVSFVEGMAEAVFGPLGCKVE